jgi:PII-like signaling protein
MRIYIAEDDRYEGIPLYEWIIRKAKNFGLAGATVFRGVEGFGARRKIHTTRILMMSEKLPIIMEIVDHLDILERFIPEIEPAIEEGLVTVEPVEVKIFKIKG